MMCIQHFYYTAAGLIFTQIPLNCSYKKRSNMKSRLYTIAAITALAAMVSCGGNDKEVVDKSIMPVGSDTARVQTTATTPATPATPPQITLPGTSTPASTVIPGNVNLPVNVTQPQNNTMVSAPQMVTQTPVPTVTQPGMNPPHGQPNHRCDIAVGAPLNSKPAAAQPTTVNAAPQQPQVTMKEIPNTTKTAPGMNPPHGEPNHRCDIAVGAPLNSKPAAPATVSTTPAATPAPLVTPVKADSLKN
jgi:hypothetical protein